MKHTNLTHKNPDGIIDHGDRSIPPSRLKYPFTFNAFPYTPPEAPTFPTHITNKKYTDDQADLARTHYVGLTPVFYFLNVAMTWTRWHVAPYVPAGTRWVEILHLNPSVSQWILSGSHNDWSVTNRWTGLRPLKQVTWLTQLIHTGYIEVFASALPAWYYLVGYWT